jgi:metallophosphoesterase superfamily enzyme
MRTALVSDLHLGSLAATDLLSRERFAKRLFDAVADCERIVLLGDTVELRDGPIAGAMSRARPFFESLGETFAGREVVLLPGNHDHRLLGPWLERARADERAVELEEPVTAPHPAVEAIREWLGEAELSVRYPGVWLRDDVYATHGHYLDSHMTLPTVERLSIATVDRMGGRPTGVRTGAHDYEQVHTPVYDLIFDLAQGARAARGGGRDGRGPSMRIWELMGGASGRARTIRGRLLGSAVLPAALSGLERAGLGTFGRDFSSAEIGRAGVAAMHTVCDRLEIGAEHVIFGHIHRRGALPGEDGRSAADPAWRTHGVTLHNTGNWLYVPAMLSRASSENPFWPGSMVVVDESGPPELVELLADVSGAELEGGGPVSAT